MRGLQMRSRILAAAMLALLALLLLLVASGHIAAAVDVVHFSDDFEGGDGPLDPRNWTVAKQVRSSNATVSNGSARLYVNGWDRLVVSPDLTMDTFPFTVEFTWLQESWTDHTLEVQVATSEKGLRWTTEAWFYYDVQSAGWYSGDPADPDAYQHRFSDFAVEADTWYRVELVVDWSRVTFRVHDRSGGEPLVDRTYYSVMDQYATVRVGAWADSHSYVVSRVDDFRAYVVDPTGKGPIEVDPIPTLDMMEDEERRVDLSPYVHDPDGDISDVHVECTDHRVVETQGLAITFLCPDDGGTRQVRLTFTDGERFTDVYVWLSIDGVNDPPELTLVAPVDGRTLWDVDYIYVEFGVEDPDSVCWTALVSVRGEGSAYLWETEEDVLNSPHSLKAAPSIGPGTYLVEVVVTDGKAQDSVGSTVHVEVAEPEVPSDDGTSREEGMAPVLLGVFVAALVIATVTMVLATRFFRRLSRSTHEASRARRYAKKAWSASHHPPLEHRAPPPLVVHSQGTPPPGPAPADPRPPAGPAGEWRVTSVEEFFRVIPDLPEGFPQPLWGIPQERVGEQVVQTSTVGPDGRPCCHVDGRAYHADKRDLRTFLKPL